VATLKEKKIKQKSPALWKSTVKYPAGQTIWETSKQQPSRKDAELQLPVRWGKTPQSNWCLLFLFLFFFLNKNTRAN